MDVDECGGFPQDVDVLVELQETVRVAHDAHVHEIRVRGLTDQISVQEDVVVDVLAVDAEDVHINPYAFAQFGARFLQQLGIHMPYRNIDYFHPDRPDVYRIIHPNVIRLIIVVVAV